MPTNGIPDPRALALQKKAGLVNIALTIVCQMNADNAAHQGKEVYAKAVVIVNELLDEYPAGSGMSELTIAPAPPQQ